MSRSAEIAKAREVDTRIAEAWNLYWAALLPIDRKSNELREARKMVRYYSTRNSGYAITYQNKIDRLEAEIKETYELAEPLAEAARKIDADEYEGWSRFFLVKHIHSSQACSSFRPTTRIGWLPKVSGLTEVEAVGEYGETLCTICYPSAPAELTTKKLDPAYCTGSGKYHSTEHLTGRENAYSSPSGYCPDCLRWNTVTSTGVMRKHKVDETKRHAPTK